MIFDRTLRVLVVDDDEDDYLMLKDILNEVSVQQFKVDWASSFDQGKKSIAKREHDICFLDFRLGVKTGLDLLKESVQVGVKTPMILLTGYGEPEVDLEAMRVGAADYLVKDQISPDLLERSIRYSIHRTQALQAILDREAQILVQDRLASVGLLASSLAHEIGTPLGVIRGRAEYLGLQVRNDENVKKTVDIIISQIDRVSTLIRSLLNLARGSTSQIPGKISLGEVVTEVVDLLAHEIRKSEIELDNGLPTGAVHVLAETGPLHQVILNLLINAIHAIQAAVKAGRTDGHRLRLSVEDLGSKWALKIEDTGCGISNSNMKNLFKPFFTTKDIGMGTGLGLATSYRIVEAWGGSIDAKSIEGKGSEFRILLPKATT